MHSVRGPARRPKVGMTKAAFGINGSLFEPKPGLLPAPPLRRSGRTGGVFGLARTGKSL
ncbi:hypothetical protein PM3016_6042 [Paenibacillus mucilaginosus 3016]|uniref:Uncharacterized protein n=1 Tax=Paenibacillus mucilaginosus 3016 TaxID=1116391 RepID=H6NQG7_9BACL|nr:hypothetical protein PM3016_6042 [Paenibacillus mucilaginosus 3016]